MQSNWYILSMRIPNIIGMKHCGKEHTYKHTLNNYVTLEKLSLHGMKGHIAIVHEGKKKIKCDTCNANFGQKSNFKNTHVVAIH